MKELFTSASIKLTMWYLLIIMTISLIFSTIIYQIAIDQIGRGLQANNPRFDTVINDRQVFDQLRQERLESGRSALLSNLLLLNSITLAGGGIGSYALARRTLRPISDAMDAQSQFSSDASHELRTPLSAMRLEIEVALRNSSLSKPEMKQVLESTLEEVGSLQRLSDSLLSLASDAPLAMQSSDVKSLTDEALKTVAPLAKEKKVTISNDVSSENISVHPDSIIELLVILLDNAVKYSNPTSKVTVATTSRSKSIVLSVTDTGTGMKAVEVAHIFDRFYRADQSRTLSKSAGFGLGLPIAKRIAEKHHTTIDVSSKPGEGSVFSIAFPKE